jgi:bifunctional non-homologous end joining protein LigD
VQEIKHDGYRLQVRRVGDQVRLFTRRGYDWSGRYPSIAVTATLLRARSFTLDGEAVVCGPDGVAIFDALHRRGTVTEAMLYAFDLLELDGEDLRGMPLLDRKKRLARLLSGRRLGIVLSDHRRGWRHHLPAGHRRSGSRPRGQASDVAAVRSPGCRDFPSSTPLA